jgi:hypothetical protein
VDEDAVEGKRAGMMKDEFSNAERGSGLPLAKYQNYKKW